jgi:hypothetical protein
MKIRALHYLIYPSVNQLFMDDMPLLFELTPREEAPQPPSLPITLPRMPATAWVETRGSN